MTKFLDIISASIGGIIGFFLGGCDGMISALLTFIVIDYITGCLVAISKKKLSSKIGYKGIAKKVFIIALVGIANIVDVQILKQGSALRTATIFFYMANEGMSIIENGINLGIPIPKKLKDIFLQINNDDEYSENNSKDS